MTTIREIAAKAGYSPATVSRLLNDDPTFSISDTARNKILETARNLNYQQISNIKKNPYNIGVIFAISPQKELEDVYYSNLRQSIVHYSNQTNIILDFYLNVTDIPDKMNGLIAIGQFNSEELDVLANQSSNCLFIDANPDPHRFNAVQPNLETITEQAIDLFIKTNFKLIGFIGGSFWHANQALTQLKDPRQKYFESYTRELGIYHPEAIYIGDDFSVKTGYELGKMIVANLDSQPLPNGFLIASDLLSVGVLQAFNENKITVPTDTSIISINDIDLVKYVLPPLTTFRIDTDQLAKVAIDTLKENIIFPTKMRKTILIDADLIYRKSFLNHSSLLK